MPNFKYKVRDRSGKAIAGTIDAPTLQTAGDRLYQLGYLPINIEEEGNALSLNPSELWRRFQKVKLEDLIFFSQQLSTLYKAGVPLLTGLRSLTEQTENKKLKPIPETMNRQVERGSTLFEAMSRYPEVFPVVYVKLPGHRPGLPGKEISFLLCPLTPPTERGLRGTRRSI